MNYNKPGGGNSRPSQPQAPAIDLSDINLAAEKIDADLFSTIADRVAREVAGDGRGKTNKATQLRRFYDEVCLWHEKVQSNPDKFDEYLPFIKMIVAKAAYSKGRELVDDNFYKFIQHCLKQVNTKKSFDLFKTFFEAFMGFYKMHKPK